MKRKTIYHKIYACNELQDYITLDDMIERLITLRDDINNNSELKTPTGQPPSEVAEYESADDLNEPRFYFHRLETDDEYSKRIKAEQQAMTKKRAAAEKRKLAKERALLKFEENERKEYERLKKKFESGSDE